MTLDYKALPQEEMSKDFSQLPVASTSKNSPQSEMIKREKTRWQRFRDYWLVDESFETLSKKKAILKLLKEEEKNEKKAEEEKEKKSSVSGVLEERDEFLEKQQSAGTENIVATSVLEKQKTMLVTDKEIIAAYCALLEPSEELLRDRAYARLNEEWTYYYKNRKSEPEQSRELLQVVQTQALLPAENSPLTKEEEKQKKELFFWCLSEEKRLAEDNKKKKYDEKIDVDALIERLQITGSHARAACEKAKKMLQETNEEEALKQALQKERLTEEEIENVKIIKQRIDTYFAPKKLKNKGEFINEEGEVVKEEYAAETNSVEDGSLFRVNSKGKRVRYFIGRLASLIFSFGCGLTTAGAFLIVTGTAMLGWFPVILVAGFLINFAFTRKHTPEVAAEFFSLSVIESLSNMFSNLKTPEKVGKALLFGFLVIAAAATGFVAGVLMYVGTMGIVSTFGLVCPPALIAFMAAITAFCIASVMWDGITKAMMGDTWAKVKSFFTSFTKRRMVNLYDKNGEFLGEVYESGKVYWTRMILTIVLSLAFLALALVGCFFNMYSGHVSMLNMLWSAHQIALNACIAISSFIAVMSFAGEFQLHMDTAKKAAQALINPVIGYFRDIAHVATTDAYAAPLKVLIIIVMILLFVPILIINMVGNGLIAGIGSSNPGATPIAAAESFVDTARDYRDFVSDIIDWFLNCKCVTKSSGRPEWLPEEAQQQKRRALATTVAPPSQPPSPPPSPRSQSSSSSGLVGGGHGSLLRPASPRESSVPVNVGGGEEHKEEKSGGKSSVVPVAS